MKELIELYLQLILMNGNADAKVNKLSDGLKYFDDEKFCTLVEWCYYHDFNLSDLYECASNVVGGKVA